MRPLLATIAAVLLALPIAALSRAPYTPPGAEAALLRLSWRMNVKAQEECRPRTAEELQALPVHMRTPEVCTADAAAYALLVRLGDAAPDTIRLRRGGAKGDRPLFVLEERRLDPGPHRAGVELLRAAGDTTTILMALDTVLRFEAGRVRLVTLDADATRLIVR